MGLATQTPRSPRMPFPAARRWRAGPRRELHHLWGEVRSWGADQDVSRAFLEECRRNSGAHRSPPEKGLRGRKAGGAKEALCRKRALYRPGRAGEPWPQRQSLGPRRPGPRRGPQPRGDPGPPGERQAPGPPAGERRLRDRGSQHTPNPPEGSGAHFRAPIVCQRSLTGSHSGVPPKPPARPGAPDSPWWVGG